MELSGAIHNAPTEFDAGIDGDAVGIQGCGEKPAFGSRLAPRIPRADTHAGQRAGFKRQQNLAVL